MAETRAKQIDFLLAGLRDPDTGDPLNGGSVEFYEVGTSTPKNVWTEPEKTNAYTSYTLDSNGVATLYGDGYYKIVVKDSGDSIEYTFPNYKISDNRPHQRSINATNTADSDDDIIFCSGTFTLNLDDVNNFTHPLIIHRVSGTITIDPYSTQTIDGSSTITLDATTPTVFIYPDLDAETWHNARPQASSFGGSATGFFSSGTIEHERGGLEADVSAYRGALAIYSGATTQLDYYVDPAATDQGALTAEGARSIKDFINTIGTSELATLVLHHTGAAATTTYTLDTSIDFSTYPNIFLEIRPGAILAQTTDETLTVYSPSHIIAAPFQKLTTDDIFAFAYPGTFFPQWVGCIADGDGAGGGTDDSTAFQIALDLVRDSGVILDLQGLIYRLDSQMTLLRNTTGGPERYVLHGNGAILDYSSTLTTGGQLLKLGATSQANAHDTGLIVAENFTIKGPESSSTALEASSPDTSLQGISLEYCLNASLNNVDVTKCYLGVITNFCFPLKATGCRFYQNYINAYIDNNSTLARWQMCTFTEAHYGVVVRPTSGAVYNQTFYQPWFEDVLVPFVIDPGSSSQTVNSIKVDHPYFEGITYDNFRIGLQWTFANPDTRNSDASQDIYGLVILDGTWDNSGYDADTAPLVFGTTGELFGSRIRIPCQLSDVVGLPDNGKNHFTFANDFYIGSGSDVEDIPIGYGRCSFVGTGSNPITAADAVGNISSTITKNGTGDYTVSFNSAYVSSDIYNLVLFNSADSPAAYFTVTSIAAGSVRFETRSRSTDAATDLADIRVEVNGRIG